MSTQISDRLRPLRGLDAITEYLGNAHRELTRRQIGRGLLDVTFDGKVTTSTPARIDNSPLITGAPPLENPPQPPRRVPWSRQRRMPAPPKAAQEQQPERPKQTGKRRGGAA